MIIRMLRPEESWRSDLVMATAFEGNYNLEKAKEEAAREKTSEELYQQARNRCFGAFTDDEKLLFACVNSRRYPCRFDGGEYLLGGVGGVSTLPPYRRSGAIRSCITASLRDMYEQDFTFSFLYPFSTQFYRKFGFEVGAEAYEWTIPFADMRPRDVGGQMEQIFPGDDMTPLLEVYQKCFANCNLSAIREKYDAGLEKQNLFDQQRYIYLWRNDAGEPRGFMITHKIHTPDGTVLDCNHQFGTQNENSFLFCDAEALNALLFFAKAAFSSDYDKIRFAVPGDISLISLVGENNSAACRAFVNGMLRVVNAERVLQNCRCRGAGSVKIEITDAILPENSGMWKLTFAPGTPNLVEKTEEPADISMPINAFSALICGARGAEDIPWMPDVRVHSADAPFDAVFYKKKCYMMDLF